ncbi:hypothetical protein D3C75_841440 [compost metagenome]
MARNGAQYAGKLHAQGHRGGVLQPGTPHQRCVGVQQGLARQGFGQRGEVSLDQRQCITQLQHQPGIHRILAGGAQVHIAFGLGNTTGDHLAQRLDQRDCRVACRGNGIGERANVKALGLAGRLDRRYRAVRHQAGSSLGTGQGSFEIEHALQTAAVRKDLAHGRGGEIGVEQ